MEEKKSLSTKEILQNLREWAYLLRISDDRIEMLSGVEDEKSLEDALSSMKAATSDQIEPKSESVDPVPAPMRLPRFLVGFTSGRSQAETRRLHQEQREHEVLQYRDEFLLSKKYDKAQKAYLMECMEKGYAFEDVKKRIGDPELSVEDMKRIMAVFGR